MASNSSLVVLRKQPEKVSLCQCKTVMKMVLFGGSLHLWEIMMSKCVNHLINRLWQNEPILRIFPEGGIMIWPEPREGPSASSSWNIPPRQICGKDFMTSSMMRADDKKGGLLDVVVWTYLNFLGNEIFQWKTTEIVRCCSTLKRDEIEARQLALQNCRKVHLGNDTRSSGDLLWISRHWEFLRAEHFFLKVQDTLL